MHDTHFESSLHSMIVCGESSPNCGPCVGGSVESNARTMDCAVGSIENGLKNRA